jgi:hypothetical protein
MRSVLNVKMSVMRSVHFVIYTGAELQNGVREDVREDAREDDVRDKVREDVREDAREDERGDVHEEVRDDVRDDGSRCSYKYVHLETQNYERRRSRAAGTPDVSGSARSLVAGRLSP